jgi:hypothetical protein
VLRAMLLRVTCAAVSHLEHFADWKGGPASMLGIDDGRTLTRTPVRACRPTHSFRRMIANHAFAPPSENGTSLNSGFTSARAG